MWNQLRTCRSWWASGKKRKSDLRNVSLMRLLRIEKFPNKPFSIEFGCQPIKSLYKCVVPAIMAVRYAVMTARVNGCCFAKSKKDSFLFGYEAEAALASFFWLEIILNKKVGNCCDDEPQKYVCDSALVLAQDLSSDFCCWCWEEIRIGF